MAIPAPLDPIEVDRGAQTSGGIPRVSPDGSQILTFRTAKPGGTATVLIERSEGGPFSEQTILTQAANAGSPSMSFTPDGGVYAIWGISTSGSNAQETFRPKGGAFVPVTAVANCNRFVDSAAGPDGQIAVTCSHNEVAIPPNTYWLGITPSLAPVPVNEQVNPAAYDPFMQPKLDWGSDGTLAVVADYWATTTSPPPPNENKRIRATIRNAAQAVNTTIDFPNVTEPAQVEINGKPAVLDDGTVAFSTGGTAGAQVQIRPPGATTNFATHSLNGEAATEPQVDADQNLHVMSVTQGPPRGYWANVRPPGGNFGTPVAIPLAGSDDPYIGFEGFTVAPDGTEYAAIRAGDGIYATSRAPGAASFETPKLLGAGNPSNNPEVAVTADSDLLAAWTIEEAVGDYRQLVGGLDKTPPKVTVTSFPVAAAGGVPLTFAAQATDNMGMRSTAWDFGGGNVMPGDDANRAFGPGSHPVKFIATDRAGNETVVQRRVVVPAGPLKLKVKVPKKLKFAKLARRGVKVKVTANQPVRIKATIGTSKRKAKLKPLRRKAIKPLKQRHTFRIKPKARRLGKPRRLKAFIRVTATTAGSKGTTVVKRVRIQR